MLLMSIEIPSVDDLLNFVDDSCNSNLRLSAILPAVSSSIDASISTAVIMILILRALVLDFRSHRVLLLCL